MLSVAAFNMLIGVLNLCKTNL